MEFDRTPNMKPPLGGGIVPVESSQSRPESNVAARKPLSHRERRDLAIFLLGVANGVPEGKETWTRLAVRAVGEKKAKELSAQLRKTRERLG